MWGYLPDLAPKQRPKGENDVHERRLLELDLELLPFVKLHREESPWDARKEGAYAYFMPI